MPDHYRLSVPPAGRSAVFAVLGWVAGVLVVVGALSVTRPSARLYLYVAHSGAATPDWLATALILMMGAGLALMTWRHLRVQPRRAATGLSAGLGVLVAYGSSEVLKVVLAQERPCRSLLYDPSCPDPGNWSFPSNHATVAFALATALVLITTGWWAWSAYLAAGVAAATRVVDGVHFPHDVFAGAALGACTTVAISLLFTGRFHVFTGRVHDYLAQRPPRAAGTRFRRG